MAQVNKFAQNLFFTSAMEARISFGITMSEFTVKEYKNFWANIQAQNISGGIDSLCEYFALVEEGYDYSRAIEISTLGNGHNNLSRYDFPLPHGSGDEPSSFSFNNDVAVCATEEFSKIKFSSAGFKSHTVASLMSEGKKRMAKSCDIFVDGDMYSPLIIDSLTFFEVYDIIAKDHTNVAERAEWNFMYKTYGGYLGDDKAGMKLLIKEETVKPGSIKRAKEIMYHLFSMAYSREPSCEDEAFSHVSTEAIVSILTEFKKGTAEQAVSQAFAKIKSNLDGVPDMAVYMAMAGYGRPSKVYGLETVYSEDYSFETMLKTCTEGLLKISGPAAEYKHKTISLSYGDMEMVPLDKNSKLNLTIGNVTACCQKLGGMGQAVCFDGWKDPNSINYVFKCGGKIVAHIWTWVAKDGSLIIDSVEGLKSANLKDIAGCILAMIDEWDGDVVIPDIFEMNGKVAEHIKNLGRDYEKTKVKKIPIWEYKYTDYEDASVHFLF